MENSIKGSPRLAGAVPVAVCSVATGRAESQTNGQDKLPTSPPGVLPATPTSAGVLSSDEFNAKNGTSLDKARWQTMPVTLAGFCAKDTFTPGTTGIRFVARIAVNLDINPSPKNPKKRSENSIWG